MFFSKRKIFFLPFLLIAFLNLLSFKSYSQSETQVHTFSADDKLEILWYGAWYPTSFHMKIEKKGFYHVRFSAYFRNHEEIVAQDHIRKIPSRSSPSQDLKLGDALEFFETDHWRPAVFVDLQKKKILVRYFDVKQPYEKWVSLKHVWKTSFPPSS